jgi:signal transduction histidine kinase/CheY-like chemotaxis protein
MRRRHHRHWLVLGGGVFALFSLLAAQLWSQRQAQLNDAGSRLRLQVRVVETNLARQLWSTHRMLSGLVDQVPAWQTPPERRQVGPWLRQLEQANPGVRTITLLDADGVVLAASRDELVGMDFGQREYFRAARAGNDARRLYLSAPFRTVLGVLSLNAVHVLQDGQGRFAGAVAATLDPDYFSLLIGSVNFAPDVWSAIAHDSGVLMMMSPPRPELEGRNLDGPGTMFARHLASGQTESLFQGVVTATADRRIIAQRTVRPLDTPVDHALVVAVSRSEDAVLDVWYGLAGNAAGMACLVLLVAALGLQGIHRAEHRAAAELSESLDQLERIAQTTPGIICQIERSEDGRLAVPFATRPLQPLLGFDASGQPVAPATMFTHAHADDAAGLNAAIEASARTMEPLRCEFRSQVPGEPERWVELHFVPQRRPDGRTVWTGLVTDATAQHAARETRIALDAAQRASRAKSEFLSRASHELRTPLNAVIGFSTLLLGHPSQPLTREQREQIGHIELAGKHLLALIDDLLDVASIEAGRVPAVIGDVPVAALLDEVLSTMGEQAAKAGVSLDAHAGDAGLTVRADRRRLKQVLLNLMSNAIKYNHEGGSVALRAAVSGEEVTIDVHDSGPGLTVEQQAHLFEPFNRLGAEFKPVPGTGIGLTITKMLVELMHGRIDVKSIAGQGSCFAVRLPAGQRFAELDHDTLPRGVLTASRPMPALRVLCIEDDATNARFIEDLLAMRPGVQLRIARSGRAGFEALREELPDLLLVDVHLGDADGIELVQRARADPAAARLRCIVLTADAMPATLQRAKAAGVVDCLTKPIDSARLLALVDAESQRSDAGRA